MNLDLLPDYEGSEAFRSDHFPLYSRGVVAPSIFLDGEYLSMRRKRMLKKHTRKLVIFIIFQMMKSIALSGMMELYNIWKLPIESDDILQKMMKHQIFYLKIPYNSAKRFYQLKKEKGIY